VRNLSEDEWRDLFAGAGLEVEEARTMERRIRFEPWLRRAGTSEENADRIRELIGDRIDGDYLRLERIALRGRKR
jgi:hypothetical protein